MSEKRSYIKGFIVHKMPFNETSEVVTILSEKDGLKSGLCKGSRQKKKCIMTQIGNLVEYDWYGRDGSLGVFALNIIKAYPSIYFKNYLASLVIISVCEMLHVCLANNVCDHKFFALMYELSETIQNNDHILIAKTIIKFECLILKEIGGTDFSKTSSLELQHDIQETLDTITTAFEKTLPTIGRDIKMLIARKVLYSTIKIKLTEPNTLY